MVQHAGDYRQAHRLFDMAETLVAGAGVAALIAVGYSFKPPTAWTRQVTCGGYSREYSAAERTAIVRRNVTDDVDRDTWLRERVFRISVGDTNGAYPITYRLSFSNDVPMDEARPHVRIVDQHACEEQR